MYMGVIPLLLVSDNAALSAPHVYGGDPKRLVA